MHQRNSPLFDVCRHQTSNETDIDGVHKVRFQEINAGNSCALFSITYYHRNQIYRRCCLLLNETVLDPRRGRDLKDAGLEVVPGCRC